MAHLRGTHLATTCESQATLSNVVHVHRTHLNIMKSALDIIWCLFCLYHMTIPHVDHMQTENIICPIYNTFWLCNRNQLCNSSRNSSV